MDGKLIEAIPNVSEGRRRDVLDQLAGAVRDTPGVSLLDVSADPSHNRAVFTMVASAEPLREALLRLFDGATRQIDLRVHDGAHPRIGAVDVVPFVPVRHTTMGDCVSLARRLGQDVADRFEIPVFLYGEAAAEPERRPLENIRRGQFEGLGAKMADARWHPDFGPPRPHPTAGASAIGARDILIAFNLNLNTDDLETAQAIARSIRERNGGLPGIKAMGVGLAHRNMAQVSINVTDYRRTGLPEVFARVEREAARRGVEIADSEIVGLAPLEAVTATAAHALRLRSFTPNQVLEARLVSPGSPSSPPTAGER